MPPPPTKRAKPYPRYCHECREKLVQPAKVEQTIKVKYDGVQYSVFVAELPVDKCESCGSVTHVNESGDAINAALRDHLHLLHPDEIRQNRDTLKLTQQQLADQIGCAAESLSRWERGRMIQSKSTDRLLRAFFHLPELRAFFESVKAAPDLGRTIVSQRSGAA